MENYEQQDLTPEEEKPAEMNTPQEPVQPQAPVYEEMEWQPPVRPKEEPVQQPAFTQQPVYTAQQHWNGYDFPPSKPKKEKKSKDKRAGGWWKALLGAVLVLALVIGSCGITAAIMGEQLEHVEDAYEDEMDALRQEMEALQDKLDRVQAGSSGAGGNVIAPEGLMTPAQVYAQNVDCVVAVNNRATTNIWGQVSETASSGSGFILSADGYIVSNYHVVEGANTLTVIMYDETEYEAQLVGYDEDNDLAVLKIEATGLPYVTLGSSDDLIVGDQVVAIGNPLGELTSSLTVGYVSGTNRDVSTSGAAINMLQTDAAINPGNSGGPLFNMLGQVVGITTAKYSGTTNSGASIEGLGFAIPIDDVTKKIRDLTDQGYVSTAYLGITVVELAEEERELLQLPKGTYITEVVKGNCADKAGVRIRDIIIGLGDYKVEGTSDLKRALQKYEPGDTVKIKLWRAGEEITLDVTLDEKPVEKPAAKPASGELPQDGTASEWYEYWIPDFSGKG